jgi:methylenetetrahydrofolate dehydrogenase (NADP+)/methenyltetrahydrofolate cyclohydrolase
LCDAGAQVANAGRSAGDFRVRGLASGRRASLKGVERLVGDTIDGKAVAAAVRAEVRARAARLAERGITVGLATVLVGDDPASKIYVGMKQKACAEAGMQSFGHTLPATTTQSELLALVCSLNANPGVHGILVQLPLPKGIDAQAVIETIDPVKDVDGLTPTSQGRLVAGMPGLRSCTPIGVMRLLDEVGTELKGARAVVVGRSVLVGKPMALLLLERHATVTMCHSRTRDLGDEIGRADVVVAAAGQAGLVRGEWIRPGAVVIDVGTNRGPDGKLRGDVEFEVARTRARAITPVPGGVGPMTVAMLLANTVTAAEWAVAARAA